MMKQRHQSSLPITPTASTAANGDQQVKIIRRSQVSTLAVLERKRGLVSVYCELLKSFDGPINNSIILSIGGAPRVLKGQRFKLRFECFKCFSQCCGSESESGSESERIRAFLAGTESESEIFVPDSDSYPNSDPDPVPDPVI